MTIPLVPVINPVPIRGAQEETQFRLNVDDWNAKLPPFSMALNATATAMNTDVATIAGSLAQADASADTAQDIYELFAAANLPQLTGTSATTSAIALGSKTITASTGKIWWPGLNVYARDAANAANFIVGPVTAYNPTTGALTINVKNIGGSGSPANWLIYPAGPRDITTERPLYEAVGTIPTVSGTAWTISPLPSVYADLHLELAGMGHNGGSGGGAAGLQVEIYDGTTWRSPILLISGVAAADTVTGVVRLNGYNLQVADLYANTGSGVSRPVPTASGIKGVRFSWTGNPVPLGDAGEIRVWGR